MKAIVLFALRESLGASPRHVLALDNSKDGTEDGGRGGGGGGKVYQARLSLASAETDIHPGGIG